VACGGISTGSAIRADDPYAKIIVLTTYDGDALARQALRAGAQGYVLKGLLREEFLETMKLQGRSAPPASCAMTWSASA
jgi:two-component system, NarL family, response regulator